MHAEKSWQMRLRERFDRFLAGDPVPDPLYLSNRSWAQKLGFAILLAAPIGILTIIIAVGPGIFRLRRANPYPPPAPDVPKAPAAKPITGANSPAASLEIVNLRIVQEAGHPVIVGVVRNNTPENISSANISYYLSDEQGGLIGSENTTVQDIGARSSVAFRARVAMPNAAYVLVREVRLN